MMKGFIGLLVLFLVGCSNLEHANTYPTAHEHVNNGPYLPGDQAYVEVYPDGYES